MRGFLIVLAACGGPPAAKPPTTQPPAKQPPVVTQDVCIVALDKLAPMLERRFQTKISPAERQKALDECHGGNSDTKLLIACFAKAPDDDALVACMEESVRPKQVGEPYEDLDKLVENLRIYHISHEVLLEGKVALTPAKACCSYPDQRCPAGSWTGDTWSTLGLDNTKARRFQLRFEGTRNKVVVEAIGDLDCDGTAITFRRELEQRADGNITVTDPKLTDD